MTRHKKLMLFLVLVLSIFFLGCVDQPKTNYVVLNEYIDKNADFNLNADLNVFGGTIYPRQGDANHAPIILTQGTMLSTITPGAIEYNHNVLYFSNLYVRRAVVQSRDVVINDLLDVNTTNEVTIYSVPHGANYLYPGKMEDIRLLGDFNSIIGAGSNTLTIRLKYAGITLGTWTTSELSRVNKDIEILATITVRTIGAGTTSIAYEGATEIIGETIQPHQDGVIGGLDSTTAQPLTITAQWSDADPRNALIINQGRVLSIDNNASS